MKRFGLLLLAPVISLLIILLLSLPATAGEKAASINLPDSNMSIPWADFKDILEKLSEAQTGPIKEKPPYDALISSAEYFVQIKEHIASIRVRAEVIVLKDEGWAHVDLMNAGIHMDKITLDGEPAALVRKSDDILHVILDDPGIHLLQLHYEAPLTDGGGPKKLIFHTIKSQVNHLSIEIGEPDLQVTFGDGTILDSKSMSSKTIATGSFVPGPDITIQWVRSVPRQARTESRVSAEIRTMLMVGEGLGVFTSIIDYEIKHKPISHFSLLLPPNVNVADVTTDGLVDWKVSKIEDHLRLGIDISYEALGARQIAVTYEKALGGEDSVSNIKVVNPALENVVHETGYLAVAIRSSVQVKPVAGTIKNLAQLDLGELPPDLKGRGDQKVLFLYKYIKHPSELELEIIKHKDASVLTCEVELASYKVMMTQRGKQIIEGTYRIANRSRQYITLTLPEGTDLWGVYRDGEPIKAAEKDGHILLPVFSGGKTNTFTMKVLAYRKTRRVAAIGLQRIDLPVLDVGINQVSVTNYLPWNYSFYRLGGKMRPGAIGHEWKKGDKAAGISEVSGEGRRRLSQTELDDLRKFDQNLAYRDENTQFQFDAVQLPVSASNVAYSHTMTRGALPVEFEINWKGAVYSFHTSIVDPNEDLSLKFFNCYRSRSAIAGFVLFLCCVYIGYILLHMIIAHKSNLLPKPPARFIKIGVLCLVALIALAISRNSSSIVLVSSFGLGAAGLMARIVLSGIRRDLAKRKETQAKIKKKGGVQAPPKPEVTDAESAEQLPIGVPVEEEDGIKEVPTNSPNDESPKGGE